MQAIVIGASSSVAAWSALTPTIAATAMSRSGAGGVNATFVRCLRTRTRTKNKKKLVPEHLKSKKKLAAVDSAYVQRREQYLKQVGAVRAALMEGVRDDASRREEEQRVEYLKRIEARGTRVERRRELHAERQMEHTKRLEEASQRRAGRREHGLQMWRDARDDHDRAKQGIIVRLADASRHWVNDQNLDEAVDRIVDDFFILPAHRTRFADGGDGRREGLRE